MLYDNGWHLRCEVPDVDAPTASNECLAASLGGGCCTLRPCVKQEILRHLEHGGTCGGLNCSKAQKGCGFEFGCVPQTAGAEVAEQQDSNLRSVQEVRESGSSESAENQRKKVFVVPVLPVVPRLGGPPHESQYLANMGSPRSVRV
jgi:hypothetical protein